MFTGQLAQNALTAFQRSQDTLYSLAKDTGGRALFDYNDLGARHRAGGAVDDQLLHARLLQQPSGNDGRFHRIRVSLRSGVHGELVYRQGYYKRQGVLKVHGRGQGAPAGRRADADNPITDISMAMEVNYFQ